MAENNRDRTSFFSSDSTETPPPPPPPPPQPMTTKSFSCKKPLEEKGEQPDAAPQSKRRKSCPTTLDKIEELSTSNGNFSFTFDTKFTPCATEFTPKFGSFNFVVSESEKDLFSLNSKDEGLEGRVEEQESGVRDSEERNDVVAGELGKG